MDLSQVAVVGVRSAGRRPDIKVKDVDSYYLATLGRSDVYSVVAFARLTHAAALGMERRPAALR